MSRRATSRAGDTPTVCADCGQELKGADPRDATITLLTDLLADLLAARAKVAHREVLAEQLDVAAWLAANRPEVDG